MESFDSSPNYLRRTSKSDSKTEGSPGGYEYDDDNISVSSSTNESAINEPYNAPKPIKNGIKHRTSSNKKILRNFGSLRRRIPKSRIIQSPLTISDDDSLADSSVSSPNYLKATSSSQGKKTHFQTSPKHPESPLRGKNTSQSNRNKSSQTLSRTSSIRNVRFLVRRTSFKPRRTSLNHSKVSEDVSVDRATYSSILKDSKFSEPIMELHSREGTESEKGFSAMRVCRYHHCSLHGHCHGDHDDSVPPVTRFVYRKRRSLKKQQSVVRKTDRKNWNLQENKMIPIVEPLSEDGDGDKHEVNAYGEMFPKKGLEILGSDDGCDDIRDLIEVAFGETSFPERSYQDNVDISRKYSLQLEQEFGQNGYCLCSCHVSEQFPATPRRAQAESLRNEVTQSALFKKPREQVSTDIEESSTFSRCADVASNKDCLETPIVSDETNKKNSVFSESQTTGDGNSEEEGGSTNESNPAADSEVNILVQLKDSEINNDTREGGKLEFSKPRHISMWHMIHQHMSSNLAVQDEIPVDEADSGLEKERLTSSRDLSDSDMGATNNDSETQEIENRKLFAIKLVREAIEKILLPEVQDQASDDLSVTGENTPRPEVMEEDKGKASDKGEGNVPSYPQEQSVINHNNASGLETKETEKEVARKRAPKHWSNLKKWILLQRFIRALEKVRKFNPKKPNILPLNPDPESEKVNLRPQTVDGKKNAEEWMLDYALRQAVNQLAPTQKKKVSLLVKAFETVVPPQEESPRVQFGKISYKVEEPVYEGDGGNKEEVIGDVKDLVASDDGVLIIGSRNQEMGIEITEKIECFDGDLIRSNGTENDEPSSSSMAKSLILDGNGKQPEGGDYTLGQTLQGLQEDAISDSGENNQMDRRNHIKMWHMIYQHVVSGIAEKVGNQLLDGEEDDDEVENLSPATNNGDRSNDLSNLNDESSEEKNRKSGFTKSVALKLIKEAVDEILLPEAQQDSSDTQSVTSGSISDEEISNVSSEGGNLTDEFEGKRSRQDIFSTQGGGKAKSELLRSKNWSKLKRLILLKRSIRALEKARKVKPQPNQFITQTNEPEQEKIELRREMMDERNKAEQWMLDYAVQHIVTKLTPSRKRRVSMLVEAFEAVVPFPEM